MAPGGGMPPPPWPPMEALLGRAPPMPTESGLPVLGVSPQACGVPLPPAEPGPPIPGVTFSCDGRAATGRAIADMARRVNDPRHAF